MYCHNRREHEIMLAHAGGIWQVLIWGWSDTVREEPVVMDVLYRGGSEETACRLYARTRAERPYLTPAMTRTR